MDWNGADINAGAKTYNDYNCEARCNAQSTCTGYAEPKDKKNQLQQPFCQTYTSRNAQGIYRKERYFCYMKAALTPAPTKVEDFECPKDKYANTKLSVKGADKSTVKLTVEKVDPLCECPARCREVRWGDFNKYYYSYWEYRMKNNQPTCTCYSKGNVNRPGGQKSAVKIKTQRGVTSGYVVDEGKEAIEQAKKDQSGGRRRRRGRRGRRDRRRRRRG